MDEALAELDDLLDALGGEKGIAVNFLGFLADAIDATRALDQADDGPRKVVIDDAGGILEVLALGKDVGGDEDAGLVAGGELFEFAVGLRGEFPRLFRGIFRIPSGAIDVLDSGILQRLG